MNLDVLHQNWGLAVAALLLGAVGVVIVAALYRRSARGQLRHRAKALRAARRRHAKAGRAVAAAKARVQKLEARAAGVKPRLLSEAREAVEDAQALEKIVGDRVLVAANHLRRVIFEEYPPARHETLRARYLPDDKPETKPFTFEGQ